MKGIRKLWLGLGLLALISPLGLLASNTAWGEWGKEELITILGYAPVGISKLGHIWHAPLAAYRVPNTGAGSGYILSAVVGVTLIVIITWGLGRLLSKKE